MTELAVGLYRGRGGAAELAKVISEQAELVVKRRVQEARRRAAMAA
jgi:hypothetical protein